MSNVTNTQNDAQGQDQKTGFFDLHVAGVGYLNRVRTVTPKKGDPFLACSISAMRGSADDVEYTKFDLRVSGSDAKEVIKLLEPEVNAKKAVIVGFKLSDIYPEVFTFEKGEKKGEQGIVIKGRLLQIKFAKVDGKTVDLPQKESAAGTDDLPKTGTDDQ